jgi:hypothetical protein
MSTRVLNALLAKAQATKPPTEPISLRIRKLMASLGKKDASAMTAAALRPLLLRYTAGLRRDYTLDTLALYLCMTRKAVAAKYGANHPAVICLLSGPTAAKSGVLSAGLTTKESDHRRSLDRERVNGYRREQIGFTSERALALIATGRRLIATSEVFDPESRHRSAGKPRWDLLLAGLLILTGRRPCELTSYGKLSPIKDRPMWAEFEGQAKTRGSDNARSAPYPIPLLAPANVIISALTRLQRAFPSPPATTPRARLATAIHDAYKTDLGASVAAYFPDFCARDLRALYGAISYHVYAPPEMALTIWLSEVLGHSLLAGGSATDTATAAMADTLTAANYERFYLSDLARSDKLKL